MFHLILRIETLTLYVVQVEDSESILHSNLG